MKAEVYFYCRRATQELTVCPVGKIVLQRDPVVNDYPDGLFGINPPNPSPTSGKITQGATNAGLLSELRPPSHTECPPQNVFGDTEGLIPDASHSAEVDKAVNPGTPARTLPPDLLLVVFIHGYVTSPAFAFNPWTEGVIRKLHLGWALGRLSGSREQTQHSVLSRSAWNMCYLNRLITWLQSA